MKVALGSAQFGLDYGVSNKVGQTSFEEVRTIIEKSHDLGIDLIDTAWAYGNSEEVLGSLNDLIKNKFKIVTKIPNIIDNKKTNTSFLEESFRRLKLDACYGLMFHHPSQLLGENADKNFSDIVKFKEQGQVEKIGCSVYSNLEGDEITSRYDIDLIQLPASPFDQSFFTSGSLKKLKNKNIEIHVRSAFLQGLYFLKENELNPYFNPVRNIFSNYHKVILEQNITPQEFVFNFFKQHEELVDYLVLGVNNSSQLNENLNYLNSTALSSINYSVYDFKNDQYSKANLWSLK